MTILTERSASTEDLVERARRGDMSAFEALHRAHAPRVFGVCLRMASDRDEAEGWSQEIWVKAWKRLDSFRAESQFGTWIHRIAINLILDRKKSEARRSQRRAMVDRGHHADDTWTRREEMMDLERAVRVLPDGARTVFLLYDVEGYRHHEIAAQLGVAEGTVKSQLHRARRLLREALSR